jgi:hypothetical protein
VNEYMVVVIVMETVLRNHGRFVDKAIMGDPAGMSNLESAVIGGYLP